MPTTILHEIFSGIQGEGVFVGLRQLFVRFHGCHLACAFCDTPASRAAAPEMCRIEVAPGARVNRLHPNPMTVDDLLRELTHLQTGYPHHSVSLTGGEPLLHREFLDSLLPALHAAGFVDMLETNGALPEALDALAEPPCYISMDMKLPSVTGQPDCWQTHAEFLAAAMRQLARPLPIVPADMTQRLQVKLVFGDASLGDIAIAADLIASINPAIPCILQPVTSRSGGPAAPSPSVVLEAQRCAAHRLRYPRVIPQTHVMLEQW